MGTKARLLGSHFNSDTVSVDVGKPLASQRLVTLTYNIGGRCPSHELVMKVEGDNPCKYILNPCKSILNVI